jgi:ribosome-associated heat shock protein Hsp15
VSDAPSARLDRWLWAARLYKTRSQAKQAIDGGKVRLEGARAKPSREITLGMHIGVPRGPDFLEVVVTGLAERRGSATEAARLYRETEASVERRAGATESRRLLRASYTAPPGRPSKRERRALDRLKHDGGPL